MIVELRAARLPSVLGYIAVHYWLVLKDGDQSTRWEVWQNKFQCDNSWGYLHKNLMSPECGIGNGESWVEVTWEGKEAEAIQSVMSDIENTYPYCDRYIAWPGPNSNTFIQWVLDKAELNYMLGPLGLGKDFGWFEYRQHGDITQFATPFFGYKYNWPGEFEMQFMTFTYGFGMKPYSIKTPFFQWKG